MLADVFLEQFMSFLEATLEILQLRQIWLENTFLPECFSHSVLNGSPFLAQLQEGCPKTVPLSALNSHATILFDFFHLQAREKSRRALSNRSTSSAVL
jgi:hypothetical protein